MRLCGGPEKVDRTFCVKPAFIKRIRTCVVLASALALFQCSARHWTVVRNAAAHHRVLVFGDSLALGVGASTPDNGFVPLIVAEMRRSDPLIQLVNFSAAGATASDVLSDQVPRSASNPATDVWLCVGANDVTHGTPTDQYTTIDHALVAALRTNWPGAHIVVFGTPDVSRSPLLPGIAKIKLHNDAALESDAAAQAARDGQADFVDLFTFSDRELDVSDDFSQDYFHPNDRGYAAIAAFAAKTIL